MKKAKLALCIVCVGVVLLAYALATILRMPTLLQYVVQPDVETAAQPKDGEEPPPTQLKQRMDAFEENVVPELIDVARSATLSGAAPNVAVVAKVGENSTSVSAGLVAIGKRYFDAYPALPYVGRLPNVDELERGDRVILLDEQIAIDLFHMVEVIDREVTVQQETYRVIGVLRHQKQVGDDADASVYVPMAALAKHGKVELRTLRMTVVPAEGGGAMATFVEKAQEWKPGGDAYDLRKERVGATIWARYLGCATGFVLLGFLIGKYVQSILWLQQTMRRRLKDRYITQLLPFLIGHILLRVVALAALAALAAWLMNLLLEPVYFYPEYIPQVVVEPKYLAETFWNLRRNEAATVVLRTSQIVRLKYFGGLCRTAVIVTLAGFSVMLLKLRKKRA